MAPFILYCHVFAAFCHNFNKAYDCDDDDQLITAEFWLNDRSTEAEQNEMCPCSSFHVAMLHCSIIVSFSQLTYGVVPSADDGALKPPSYLRTQPCVLWSVSDHHSDTCSTQTNAICCLVHSTYRLAVSLQLVYNNTEMSLEDVRPG